MEAPEIRKLKNGTTLVFVPKAETKIIDLIISFRVGSRYEDATKAGISHFYEHMMFDGTEKRPTANIIAKEVDAMGAHFNAHTSDEYTSYYISASQNHFEKVIEILGDILSSSLLSEKDIKKEKNVISEEIKMYQDMPGEYVSELFSQAIFHGDPLSRDVLGDYQTINSINQQDLKTFKDKFYVAENCYIGIGGNFSRFSRDEIVELIEKNLRIGNGSTTEIFPAKISQQEENYLVKDTAQTNLVAGFIGPSYGSDEYFAFRTLSVVLGGNMSSRMFNKIREELELAYDVRTDVDCTSTVGSISTSAGVPNEKYQQALQAIFAEYQRIKTDLLPDEVKKAKMYQIGQLALSTENSYNLTYLILRYYFTTGKPISIDDFIAKINAVTFNDVEKIAAKYLIPDKIVVAAIGPSVNK